jgi:hypothetical protein
MEVAIKKVDRDTLLAWMAEQEGFVRPASYEGKWNEAKLTFEVTAVKYLTECPSALLVKKTWGRKR